MAIKITAYTIQDTTDQTMSIPLSANPLGVGNSSDSSMSLWAESPDDADAEMQVISLKVLKEGDSVDVPMAFLGRAFNNAGEVCFVYQVS